jgi:hypothetical protein
MTSLDLVGAQPAALRAATPLWRRILGPDFDRLPAAVRTMFDASGHRYASGLSQVEVGRSWLARLAAFLAGFPCPARDAPVSILFQAEGGADIWHRSFGTRRFSSAHLEEHGHLVKRFGALAFVFRLEASESGVRLVMRETRLFGRRLPRRLSPRIAAEQSERAGLFRFEITVDLPVAGRMARLVGLLNPPGRHAPIAHCA